MFAESVWDVIKQVLVSWQVIAVTIGIVIYLNIVFFTARYYRTPRMGSVTKKISFKKKKEKKSSDHGGPEEAVSSGDSNEELGLEEA